MRFTYSLRKMAKLFANSGDPDQTPHSAASDLGLHCLPSTLLRVSQLQWVKGKNLLWRILIVFFRSMENINCSFRCMEDINC